MIRDQCYHFLNDGGNHTETGGPKSLSPFLELINPNQPQKITVRGKGRDLTQFYDKSPSPVFNIDIWFDLFLVGRLLIIVVSYRVVLLKCGTLPWSVFCFVAQVPDV